MTLFKRQRIPSEERIRTVWKSPTASGPRPQSDAAATTTRRRELSENELRLRGRGWQMGLISGGLAVMLATATVSVVARHAERRKPAINARGPAVGQIKSHIEIAPSTKSVLTLGDRRPKLLAQAKLVAKARQFGRLSAKSKVTEKAVIKTIKLLPFSSEVSVVGRPAIELSTEAFSTNGYGSGHGIISRFPLSRGQQLMRAVAEAEPGARPSKELAEGPGSAEQSRQQPHPVPMSAARAVKNIRKPANINILVGTKITIANWRRYRAFMSDGMIALFSGRYGIRMPKDVEIDVGPAIHVAAPSTFRRATEKYSSRVRVVHLRDGRNDVAGYVAGEPFPNPAEPDKGYKILADSWYAYGPHLAAGLLGMGLWNVIMLDRFGNANTAKWAFVYRQLAFNTDPGVPRTDPRAATAFYTQWLMAEEPEQAKYTVDLDILPQNNQEEESSYVFLPALRHPIRFSVGARCASLLGTDWTHDDQKPGFNGGLASFDADYVREMRLLSLVQLTGAVAVFPSQYDMPMGFARPSWGQWSLRRAWVIDIHRIPSEAASYCYSKRIDYIDEETMRNLWEDLYDSRRQLWKVTMSAYYPRKVPGTDGETIYGRFAAATWDLQNRHATFGYSTDSNGRLIAFNSEVPKRVDNVISYSTPAGLTQIMR